MPNALIDLYRQYLADNGQKDDRDDYFITQELGQMAKTDAPELFQAFPDFGKEYGAIREANAPSLAGEASRALKQGTIGLGSTALGGAGLFTGSDYLKRKAQALDMMASDPDLAPTIGTLEDIAPGRTGPAKYLSRDALRYAVSKVGQVAPSIAESAATAIGGAVIGSSMAPGPGTLAGGVGGVLGKAAIKSLIKKGIAKQMVERGLITDASEAAISQALKAGSKAVAADVATEAAAIGGLRGGIAANAAGSLLLNSGDVASEGAGTGTSIGLGIISAIPDIILPAYVLTKFFPGMGREAAKQAGKTFLARNALKIGEAIGIPTEEFGQEAFQQAVNVVARNIKEGKDPLMFTDENAREIREAGITGAFGGLLAAPGVMVSGRERQAPAEEASSPPPAPPVAPAPMVPPPAPVVSLLPSQRVQAMTPEAKVARLAELSARPRIGDEEAEYQILRALTPTAPIVAPPIASAPTLEGIQTNALPTELGALNPPVPEVAAATPTTPEEEALAVQAEQAAQTYAAGQGMVGAPLAPELILPPPADVAGSMTPIPGVDVVPVTAIPLAPAPAAKPEARAPDGGIDDMMLATAAAMNSLPKDNIYAKSARILLRVGEVAKGPENEQAALRAMAENVGVLAREVRRVSPKSEAQALALEASRDKAIDVLRKNAPRPAPAEFAGMMGPEGHPKSFEQYNLTEDVPELGLTKGASVSRKRLEDAGFTVPERRAEAKAQAVLGKQIVKIPAKRAETGEMIEIEMTAKKAEKMLTSRIEVMNKLLACLST